MDYHPANDMFFSGHTGTLVVAGIQFYTTNFMFVALLHFLFALPLVATLVVAFRVHRGIDVLAAIFAAIAACSIAENIADQLIEHFKNVEKQKHRSIEFKNTPLQVFILLISFYSTIFSLPHHRHLS